MIEVSVRELKSRLSHYLRKLEEGEQITVTKRGKPVTTISSSPPSRSLDEKLQDMAARGLITYSGKKFVPPKRRLKLEGEGPTISEMVLGDRR